MKRSVVFALFLLFCAAVTAGCQSEDIAPDSPKQPVQSPEQACILPIESVAASYETLLPVEPAKNDDNPFAGFDGYWRYEVYEIFRGSEIISFDATIDYSWVFSLVADEENYLLPLSEEYIVEITLPQATASDEPWVEAVNAYYIELMTELVNRSEYILDAFAGHDLRGFTHNYEGAYRTGNVITVMHTDFVNVGSRPLLALRLVTNLFSAHDGQRLELDDLFLVGQDEYLPLLQTLLLNAENRFYEGYSPRDGKWFRSLFSPRIADNFDRAAVAVTPAGLIFIFPTGAVSCNACGIVFLDVPYDDLHGILNPSFFPDHTA